MAEAGDIVGGKYRLVRKLGEGGMGTVFEAVDEAFGGQVAVKLIHPELEDTTDTISRFRREAEAAAAAGHEAIVGVFDFGETGDGSHYLVMELLNGQSLNDRLNDTGNLDIATTAYIGCQTLSGLSAAHRVGVIHRDLKPDNIFLVDTGGPVPSVKILDFGTSLLLGQMGFTESTRRLTREGTIIGTPEYMSPEQARGTLDVDERTDIYALGLILYECVTGRPPFVGRTPNEVLFKVIMDAAASPRTIRPDISEEFEALIMGAISKERDERPQTSRAFFEALAPFVDDSVAYRLIWPVEEASTEAPTGFETYRVDMPEEVTDLESLEKYVSARAESATAAQPAPERMPLPSPTPPPQAGSTAQRRTRSGPLPLQKPSSQPSADSSPQPPSETTDHSLELATTIPMKTVDVELALARRAPKTPRFQQAPIPEALARPRSDPPLSAPSSPAPLRPPASPPIGVKAAASPPAPLRPPASPPIGAQAAASPPAPQMPPPPPPRAAMPLSPSPAPAPTGSAPPGPAPFDRTQNPRENVSTYVLKSRSGKGGRNRQVGVIAFIALTVLLFILSVTIGIWIAFRWVGEPDVEGAAPRSTAEHRVI